MPRYSYTTETDPPAPFVYLSLANRETSGKLEQFLAQVDSGADITVLPANVVADLGLAISGMVRATGYTGTPERKPVHRVDVAVRGVDRVVPVEVLSADDLPYALIGLDALKSFRVILDGPAQTLDIE